MNNIDIEAELANLCGGYQGLNATTAQGLVHHACSACHNSKRKCQWTADGKNCKRCSNLGLVRALLMISDGGGNQRAYFLSVSQDCIPHKPLQRGRQRNRPTPEWTARLEAQLQLRAQQKTVQGQLEQLKTTAPPMDRREDEDKKPGGDNPIKRAKMAAAEAAIARAIKQATATGASASEKKKIVEFAVASAVVAAAEAAWLHQSANDQDSPVWE
jgi:hypothetical protein